MGLVYNSIVDKRRDVNFSAMLKDEMHYHMHIADVHYGMSKTKSKGVCEIMSKEYRKSENAKRMLITELKRAYKDAISDVCGEDVIPSSALEAIEEQVNKKAVSFFTEEAKRDKARIPMQYKDLQRN